MRLGTGIGTSADALIDTTICEAAARQNSNDDLNSNAVVDSPHSRSPFGPFGLPVMFKACGLLAGVSRLQIHSIRALWAPRAVRSFTTTPKSSRKKQSPPTIETNELQSHELEEATLPSTKASERGTHRKTEDETFGDTSRSLARHAARKVASGNAYGDSKVQQGQTAWENETAKEDQSKVGEVPWRDKMGHFQREITVPQDFHAKLHATLLKNIMRSTPVLRGMPVYDSTFDAVRSSRNLFIQTALSTRSLQYLLPLIQSILDFGIFRRRREVKPDAQLPLRPTSLLVLCPTLGGAQDIQSMGTRLQSRTDVVEIMILTVPSGKQINPLRDRGFNILISTPEIILQWLALPHANVPLTEALQDVQTLVVDGQASSLRRGDFLELLKEVMKDLPLHAKTQRVLISDEHDPKLDERLTSVVLHGGHELLQEPRVEEILEMDREQHKKRQQREQSLRAGRRGKADRKPGYGRAKERF